MVKLLIEMFRKNPPCHPSTCDILKDRIQEINADNLIMEEIMNYRLGLFEKMKSEKCNKTDIEKIKNWID